jgi:hypothetical protein
VAADRAANGGKLTAGEKAQVNKEQNKASKNIYDKKHNVRTKPGTKNRLLRISIKRDPRRVPLSIGSGHHSLVIAGAAESPFLSYRTPILLTFPTSPSRQVPGTAPAVIRNVEICAVDAYETPAKTWSKSACLVKGPRR